MLSLCIFAAILILSLMLTSWALAIAARAAGSPRGRFFVAMGCVLTIAMVNVGLAVVGNLRGPTNAAAMLGRAIMLTAAQLFVAFVLMRRWFRLPTARALAPFGAYLLMIFLQVVLALAVLRPYATEAFVIPTQSMSPTIPPGGRIVVNKLLPQPRRWDVVVYWSGLSDRSVYCKRLVALPGERLRFENGQVYINDQLAPAPPVLAGRCHAAMPWYADGESHPGETRYQDGETITLGPDEYFFIGDNAEISLDSRSAGPSKRSSLVGVADLIYWPLSRLRVLR